MFYLQQRECFGQNERLQKLENGSSDVQNLTPTLAMGGLSGKPIISKSSVLETAKSPD